MSEPVTQHRIGVTRRMRLRRHDYAEPGYYFLTSVTEGRACLFGDVTDHQFNPLPAGQMIVSEWRKLQDLDPDIVIDEFCVMPNHFHAIVGLDATRPLETLSIPRLMQVFKSRTTVIYGHEVRQHGWTSYHRRLWQPGYYDHIIRNDRDLDRIREYIEANPASWNTDRLFSAR